MEDGKRSCDVVGKKASVVKSETPVAKAVKTRDRGTQTLKPKAESKKRPVSAETGTQMDSKPASKTKKGAAASELIA